MVKKVEISPQLPKSDDLVDRSGGNWPRRGEGGRGRASAAGLRLSEHCRSAGGLLALPLAQLALRRLLDVTQRPQPPQLGLAEIRDLAGVVAHQLQRLDACAPLRQQSSEALHSLREFRREVVRV